MKIYTFRDQDYKNISARQQLYPKKTRNKFPLKKIPLFMF